MVTWRIACDPDNTSDRSGGADSDHDDVPVTDSGTDGVIDTGEDIAVLVAAHRSENPDDWDVAKTFSITVTECEHWTQYPC